MIIILIIVNPNRHHPEVITIKIMGGSPTSHDSWILDVLDVQISEIVISSYIMLFHVISHLWETGKPTG